MLRITDGNIADNGPESYQGWADYYNLGSYFGTPSDVPDYIDIKDTNQYLLWLAAQGGKGIKDKEGLLKALVLLYNQGSISANDLSGYLQYLGVYNYDPTFEKWLDNQISLENTNSARNWEQQMAETSLIRSSEQLKQIGLSPSTVLQAGGSNVNPVGAADNVKTNMAQQRYEQRMQTTRSLISMVTGMASAGIGGTAMGLARGALARQGMATAHNALGLLGSKDLNKVGFAKYADSHKGPGTYTDLNDSYYGPSWDQLMNMFKD